MRTNEAQERVPNRPRRMRPSRGFRRTVTTTLLVFAVALGAGLGYLWISNKALRQTVGVIVRRDYSPSKAFPGRDEVTILFLGKDTDRDNHGRVVNTRGRADAIIVAHLDFAGKAANLLSIPRDTSVRIPGYRGRHKINASHAYGGPELTEQTVARLLGVEPDGHIVVDYDGFVKGIDYVGGLNINVDKQLDYDDDWGQLHIHLKPGRQWLDGYQAMGFVRYRKSNDGHGDTDLERIARQQEFVRAAKEKLMQPTTMFKLPGVLSMAHDNVSSSLTYEQMCSVAYFLKKLPEGSIHTVTLPSHAGRVVVRADEDATRELVRKMFY